MSRSSSSSAFAPSSPSSCANRPEPAYLRLVFAGTPQFAKAALARLLAAGHDIALVLSQPDRPAGRGLHASASAVKQLAVSRNLELYQPQALREDAVARVLAARPAALVVAAYGLLLPPSLLAAGRYGALNIHASLLPRWRGAAPIQRALLAGDRDTGISIMQMDAGLDTGPVLAQQRLAIDAQDDAGTLHDKLARLGADMIVDCLAAIERGEAHAAAQAQEGVTYARKIEKAETLIDWAKPAAVLERSVRAFRPEPGAAMRLHGEVCKVWRARVVERSGRPGDVLDAPGRLIVACAEHALEILELQRPGGRRLEAGQFLRGRPLAAGTSLP